MKYALALAAMLSDVTASVATRRAELNYADFTYNSYAEALARAYHLSPKVTYRVYTESDFEDVDDLEQSDNSDDLITYQEFAAGLATLQVEPCESVVIELRMENDFSNNWLVS